MLEYILQILAKSSSSAQANYSKNLKAPSKEAAIHINKWQKVRGSSEGFESSRLPLYGAAVNTGSEVPGAGSAISPSAKYDSENTRQSTFSKLLRIRKIAF